jgi:ligand-binding SRPBCC domain-containing protein
MQTITPQASARSSSHPSASFHSSRFAHKGPFKTWHHRHEFKSEKRNAVEGTLVSDVIDYEVGFGFAGRIANRFLIRPQMHHTFAKRQSVLPDLLS